MNEDLLEEIKSNEFLNRFEWTISTYSSNMFYTKQFDEDMWFSISKNKYTTGEIFYHLSIEDSKLNIDMAFVSEKSLDDVCWKLRWWFGDFAEAVRLKWAKLNIREELS